MADADAHATADRDQGRTRAQPWTLLLRLYPSIACMRQAILGLAGPHGLRAQLEASLSQPGDPAAYTETLLQQTLVWLPPHAPPLPQQLTLLQRSSQAEVHKRAVEVLVRSSAKSSNLLCLGSAKGMHSAEQRSAHTATLTLFAPPWPLLLSRLGDALMLYLLLHACIFVPLPNRCYLQVAGPPVAQRVWAQWRANVGRSPPVRSAPARPPPAPLHALPVLTQEDDCDAGGDAQLAPMHGGVPATQAEQASCAWECGALAAEPEQPAAAELAGRRAHRSARASSWQRRRAAARRTARQANPAQGLPGAARTAATAGAGYRCGGQPVRLEGSGRGDVDPAAAGRLGTQNPGTNPVPAGRLGTQNPGTNPAPAGRLGTQNPGRNPTPAGRLGTQNPGTCACVVAAGGGGASGAGSGGPIRGSRRRGSAGWGARGPVGLAPRGWVPPATDVLPRWRVFYGASFRPSPGLPKGRALPAVLLAASTNLNHCILSCSSHTWRPCSRSQAASTDAGASAPQHCSTTVRPKSLISLPLPRPLIPET